MCVTICESEDYVGKSACVHEKNYTWGNPGKSAAIACTAGMKAVASAAAA